MIYYTHPKKINTTYSRTSIEEALDYLNTLDIIGLDVETTGLDPNSDELVMITFGNTSNQYVMHPSYLSELESLLRNKEFILHNSKFDLQFFFKKGIILYDNIHDTYIAEQVKTNGKEKSRTLQDLLKEYLGVEITKYEDIKVVWDDKYIKYAAEDVEHLIPLFDAIDMKEHRGYDLERLYTPVLAYTEYKGADFDTEMWMQSVKENREEIMRLEKQLHLRLHSAPFNLPLQQDIFSSPTTGINLGSSKQMITLFKKLGISILNKEGNDSIDIKELSKFADVDPFVDKFVEYKKAIKLDNTYGVNVIEQVNKNTGKLHSSYRQILNTYRISSSKPNLQNIPKVGNYRKCFHPEEGYTYLNCDAANQEARILADKAQEQNMLKFYLEHNEFKGDSHSYVASLVFKDKLANVHPLDIKKLYSDKRELSKIVGFTINYGGGPHNIATTAGISVNEAMEVTNQYFKAFPDLDRYFNKCKRNALKDGEILINAQTGCITYMENYIKSNKRMYKHDVEKAAMNYPIQGTAAHMIKLAAIWFFHWTIKENIVDKVYIMLKTHDELTVKTPLELVDKTKPKLEQFMEEAATIFCKKVPIPAEAKVAPYWAK